MNYLVHLIVQALDPFHIYGKTKRLINKPIVTFDDSDLYLRIVGASNDGLIKYSFGIPQNVFEVKFTAVFTKLFDKLFW